MKQLIDLFNKKYGSVYGVIDDSIDNEDVYKVYKMIKSLCGNDQEIMEMLNKIKLPSPRTAKESIEKINAEHVSGGSSESPFKCEWVDILPENLTELNYNYNYEFTEEDRINNLEVTDDIEIKLELTYYDGVTKKTVIMNKDNLMFMNWNGYCEWKYFEDTDENGGCIGDLCDMYYYYATDKTLIIDYMNTDDWEDYTIDKIVYFKQNQVVNKITDKEIESISFDRLKNYPEDIKDILNKKKNTLRNREYYALTYYNLITDFSKQAWSNTPFENVKVDISNPYNSAEGSMLEIGNVYQEGSVNSVGYKVWIDVEDKYGWGYQGYYILVLNAPDLSVSLVDENRNVIENYNPTQGDERNYRNLYFKVPKSGYYYILLAKNNYFRDGNRVYDNSIILYNSDYKKRFADFVTDQTYSRQLAYNLSVKVSSENSNLYVTNDLNQFKALDKWQEKITVTLNVTDNGQNKSLDFKDFKLKTDFKYNENIHCAWIYEKLDVDNNLTDYSCKIYYKHNCIAIEVHNTNGDAVKVNKISYFYQYKPVKKINLDSISDGMALEHIKGYDTLVKMDNTIPYEPTEDYNPATKKYVDEVIGNVLTTTNNVNDSLTLTTDKLQYTTLSVPVEIILPTVTTYTEIHLFFSGSEGAELNTTNVKWESQLTIENNKSYEVVFTYVNDVIGWLAKSIIYN